jgi:hypothetical protein
VTDAAISRSNLTATPEGAKPLEGAGLASSVYDAAEAIGKGDWAGFGINMAGVGLDALGMVMDPIRGLLSAGIGWLMEHVGFLNEFLDKLAGDPGVVKASAETWQNIGIRLNDAAGFYQQSIDEVSGWTGSAGDGYRAKAGEFVDMIKASASGAQATSGAISQAGIAVSVTRALIRDLIAEFVAFLLEKGAMALASSWFTLGGSVAAFIGWATAEAGILAGKLTSKISKLVDALADLLSRMRGLGTAFDDMIRGLRTIAVKLDGAAGSIGRSVGGNAAAAERVVLQTFSGGANAAGRVADAARPTLNTLDGWANRIRSAPGGNVIDSPVTEWGGKAAVETGKGAHESNQQQETSDENNV